MSYNDYKRAVGELSSGAFVLYYMMQLDLHSSINTGRIYERESDYYSELMNVSSRRLTEYRRELRVKGYLC